MSRVELSLKIFEGVYLSYQFKKKQKAKDGPAAGKNVDESHNSQSKSA